MDGRAAAGRQAPAPTVTGKPRVWQPAVAVASRPPVWPARRPERPVWSVKGDGDVPGLRRAGDGVAAVTRAAA